MWVSIRSKIAGDRALRLATAAVCKKGPSIDRHRVVVVIVLILGSCYSPQVSYLSLLSRFGRSYYVRRLLRQPTTGRSMTIDLPEEDFGPHRQVERIVPGSAVT